MTFSRLDAITKYHETNPPLHVMVASYLGYYKPENRPKKKKTETENTPDDVAEFARLFSSFGGTIG